VTYRFATARDCPLLGELNHQLIQDEGHRNPMSVAELEERMRTWLDREYIAVLFENAEGMFGYALFRSEPNEIYLRQLFIARHLRRKGFGRAAINLLRTQIWPPDRRLVLDVLVENHAAIAFWHSVGYSDYALTMEILPAT
jgi:predicted acetyltransferase